MRKRVAFLVVVMLLALAVSACGCAATRANDAEDANNLTPIVVGADMYPPYVSNDENGNPVGIDVDVAREAFHRIGYEPTFQYIVWEKKGSLLADSSIDCVMSCFSMTGREDQYRWAGPYMKSRQVIAVDPASSIYRLSDLEGKVLALQSSTKPEEIILNGTNPNMPQLSHIYSFSDRSYLVPALSKGYVDAIAAHETSVLQYEKDYGVELRILDESLQDVGLGVAFDKNDERGIDSALQGALDDMRADGTMERILSNYFDDTSSFLNVESLYE